MALAHGDVPIEVETSLIPLDLRMPNSELLLLMRKDTSEIAEVLRVGEEMHDARFSVDNALLLCTTSNLTKPQRPRFGLWP
jgi:hypothetical protein